MSVTDDSGAMNAGRKLQRAGPAELADQNHATSSAEPPPVTAPKTYGDARKSLQGAEQLIEKLLLKIDDKDALQEQAIVLLRRLAHQIALSVIKFTDLLFPITTPSVSNSDVRSVGANPPPGRRQQQHQRVIDWVMAVSDVGDASQPARPPRAAPRRRVPERSRRVTRSMAKRQLRRR